MKYAKQVLLYIIFTMLLTSCVTPRYTYVAPEKRGYKDLTNTEKVEQCVYRLIERDGIAAKDAEETCSKIFRRDSLSRRGK
jgi:hypothetical protein